jgi:hypothetical protein
MQMLDYGRSGEGAQSPVIGARLLVISPADRLVERPEKT